MYGMRIKSILLCMGCKVLIIGGSSVNASDTRSICLFGGSTVISFISAI